MPLEPDQSVYVYVYVYASAINADIVIKRIIPGSSSHARHCNSLCFFAILIISLIISGPSLICLIHLFPLIKVYHKFGRMQEQNKIYFRDVAGRVLSRLAVWPRFATLAVLFGSSLRRWQCCLAPVCDAGSAAG